MFHRLSRSSNAIPRMRRWALMGCLGAALSWNLAPLPVQAKDAGSTPAAITQVLAEIDQASNAQDLTRLLQVYSPDFRHTDGLDRKDFSRSLERFWNQYSNLTYSTEVLSWDETPTGTVVETSTTIQGKRQDKGREFRLDAKVRSQQTFEQGRLTRQAILSEESTVKTGPQPPKLAVNLPDKVRPSESFNFDVIVLEPLENDLLLGGVLDEQVRADAYPDPSKVAIEPLVDPQTGTGPGGIFKVGKAPRNEGERWISAVVVRKTGITMVTRRLQVANR